MIRVLNIIDTMASGGVERRRLSLAKLLDKSKFELKIICTNALGPFPDQIRQLGVEVIEIGDLKTFSDFKQHKKVMNIIDDFKPHIVHGAVFEGVTMTAINGFLKRVPVVILEETSDPQNRRWKGNLLMKLFCSMADKVVGVSPAATEYLKNKLHLSDKKVILINNGVVIPEAISDLAKEELKAKYHIKDGEIVIGSVGRMSSDKHKRFSDLIKAFAILAKEHPNVKLLLVGDGSERINYERLVDELQINNKVIFAGYQNSIGNFYSIFDIFCLVSAYEAFGLVLAEAMLHKLPVIATKVGGMQYIVDENETGFLVEKFDVAAIKTKMNLLCNDRLLREAFGQKGFEKAMIKYTEERYVKDVENLYLELIQKKKVVF